MAHCASVLREESDWSERDHVEVPDEVVLGEVFDGDGASELEQLLANLWEANRDQQRTKKEGFV